MSIALNNVRLLNGKNTNILINENIISSITKNKLSADKVIDCKGKLAIPPFYNMHTHAAMTLFRGYAEDMPLMKWLKEYIWPIESQLTVEDVYHGTRLACLEMIKSGTVFFMDMYLHLEGSFNAVKEMGLRANLSSVLIDMLDNNKPKRTIDRCIMEVETFSEKSSRIDIGLGPHAIYSVAPELLQWAAEFASSKNITYHIHLCETEFEVAESLKKNGLGPLEYLEKLGVLKANIFAAHSIYLNDNELNIARENNIKFITNPVSNLKLASGIAAVWEQQQTGIEVFIGTDGCSSNNNLDMMEEMKFTALLQKYKNKDITQMPSEHVFNMATLNPAKAMKINAGEIALGKLADILLLNLNSAEAHPLHNPISNIIYSMNGSSADTLICNGKILMENRVVPNEEKIIQGAKKTIKKLFSNLK